MWMEVYSDLVGEYMVSSFDRVMVTTLSPEVVISQVS